MIRFKDLPGEEYFRGQKACGGCGGTLAVRLALKVFGPRTLAAVPAGCMSAVGFIFPQMAFGVNAMIAPFAATGAVLTGLATGARARGWKDFKVVGFAGDGATADIGLQALSGALERWDPVVYICYDNEAYMNTGIQKSGATPWGAKTTTTPGSSRTDGSVGRKKNLLEIAAAHGIPYAATASVGYPQDYLNKLEKAKAVDGPVFLHVLAPCPTGWGSATNSTIRLAQIAVTSGLWPLVEYENGRYTLNSDPRHFTPLEDYLGAQTRFRGLSEEDILGITQNRDRRWEELRLRAVPQGPAG